MLSLRCREKASAMKRDNYSCVECGAKKSTRKGHEVKLEMHHVHGIQNWAIIIETIRKYLLCKPEDWQTLCKNCHTKHTENDAKVAQDVQKHGLKPRKQV
jgi:5-methylcytosine-specific restriction endonuclease McrA